MKNPKTFCPDGMTDHSPHRWRAIRLPQGYQCEQCFLVVEGETDPTDELRARLMLHELSFELALLGVGEFSDQNLGQFRVYYGRPIDDEGASILRRHCDGKQRGKVLLPGGVEQLHFVGPSDLREGFARESGLPDASCAFVVSRLMGESTHEPN